MGKGTTEKPSYGWENEFRHRLDSFGTGIKKKGEGLTLSIKTRVTGGCFHRQHSPNAYKIIDEYFRTHQFKEDKIEFVEHESGPEVLVYITFGTAVLMLSKSVIDLVVAIIKSRQEGVKRGDGPNAPIELIVRGFDEKGEVKEEKVLKFESWDAVSRSVVEGALQTSVKKFRPLQPKKKERKP